MPWLVGMPAETCLSVCAMMLGGVLDKVPNLKVMFSHSGGSFPGTVGRIEWGYKCRPDLVLPFSSRSRAVISQRFVIAGSD
jgi:aminocarboxymuconate-semialdehyde decarboxylase